MTLLATQCALSQAYLSSSLPHASREQISLSEEGPQAQRELEVTCPMSVSNGLREAAGSVVSLSAYRTSVQGGATPGLRGLTCLNFDSSHRARGCQMAVRPDPRPKGESALP